MYVLGVFLPSSFQLIHCNTSSRSWFLIKFQINVLIDYIIFIVLFIYFSCFESYAENDSECPACMPENRSVTIEFKNQLFQTNLQALRPSLGFPFLKLVFSGLC